MTANATRMMIESRSISNVPSEKEIRPVAQKIQFEANELTQNSVIEKLKTVGYSVTERNSCNIVVEL